MVSYQFRMPAGIPGEVTRSNSAVVEPNIPHATTPPTAFGTFCKMLSGAISKTISGDAASSVYGIVVRPYPTSNVGSSALGGGSPSTVDPLSVLRSGYANVALARGTAVRGAQVYLLVTATTGKLVGDIEDAADAGNCVAVTGCFFMGAADAGGNVEVSYNV